jgi:Domain of unknown function (DUF4440)
MACCTPIVAQQAIVVPFELARFEAMTRRDTMALRGMLHDELLYVHSNWLAEDKSAHIEAIRTGKIVYAQIRSEVLRRKRWHRTTMINGIAQVEGSFNGTPFSLNLRYTSVYRKVKGRWLLLNWQSTKKP